MKNSFNNFEWHDAILHNIIIDRLSDTIKLSVEWLDNNISEIVFEECYAFNSNMNFGIASPESLLMAEAIYIDSDETILIKNKWKKVGVELDNLVEFRIETNSTASIIKIFALRVTFHSIVRVN